MIIFLLILALIVAVVAIIFALQNTAAVSVAFLTWQFEQSLALVFLVALAAGILIGILIVLPGSIRNRWHSSGQKKRIDNLEKNLKETQLKLEQTRLENSALQQKPEPAVPAAPAVEPAQPPDVATPSEPLSENN